MGAGREPTLAETFEMEVVETVGTLQAHLMLLEQGAPDGAALLADMLRLTHDIKGSARVVRYERVSHLSHAFESRLTRWRGLGAVSAAEIGLALRACDLLAQLTATREAPEAVARAEELGRELEGRQDAPVPPAPPRPPQLPTPPARTRPGSETLRISRQRVDDVIANVADALGDVLAISDVLTELKRVSQDLQRLSLPRDAASPREIARSRGEAISGHQRLRRVVQRMGDAMRLLDTHIRLVDEDTRELCLVPFAPLATHLERVAHDAAATLGRELRFSVEGREREIDKLLLDAVKGPLTHAVRNAVDHGIEPPAERERAGKPRAGELRLALSDEDQSVCLRLSDDGRGIDRDAVRARLGAAAAGLDDRQLLATLLNAGISTRETVTELSGRGVGLGSLAAVTQGLPVRVALESEPGRGTTLELRMPLKLSLLQGLLVEAAGCRFILPRDALVSIRSDWTAPVPLASLLGLSASGPQDQVVVLRGRHGPAGIAVDRIDNRMREVVRRPLGSHLGRAPFVQGAALIGDDGLALILDPREVAEACHARAGAEPVSAEPVSAGGRRVLLVDDSQTLRAALQRALARAGYAVDQAADGLAALELLIGSDYDAIVSDVQMPRMDGWQLLQQCAGRAPFVLMTSCPDADGTERARRAGACAYLLKDDALGSRVVAALETALTNLQESSP